MYNVVFGGTFSEKDRNGVMRAVHKTCVFQATNTPINTNGTCGGALVGPTAGAHDGDATGPKCEVSSNPQPQSEPTTCIYKVTFTFGEYK
jgi:hypothetical protein